MKRILIIILILFASSVSTEYFSQSGGRKREAGGSRSHGKFSLKRTKSKGHADEFARSKKKGIFSRLFKKDQPSWSNRNVGTKGSNTRTNRHLFKRRREDGHMDNQNRLEKQNAKREKRRSRGNEKFGKKKYK